MGSAVILLGFFQILRWVVQKKTRMDNTLAWKGKFSHGELSERTILFLGDWISYNLIRRICWGEYWFASLRCSGRLVDRCFHHVFFQLIDFVNQFIFKYGKTTISDVTQMVKHDRLHYNFGRAEWLDNKIWFYELKGGIYSLIKGDRWQIHLLHTHTPNRLFETFLTRANNIHVEQTTHDCRHGKIILRFLGLWLGLRKPGHKLITGFQKNLAHKTVPRFGLFDTGEFLFNFASPRVSVELAPSSRKIINEAKQLQNYLEIGFIESFQG
jgi:hypothetical protein